MLMTLLGRACPELPAEVLLSEIAVTVLNAFANQSSIKPPANPGDAVRLAARPGGFPGRTNDPPSRHQIMWQGYAVRQMLCLGFCLSPSDTS